MVKILDHFWLKVIALILGLFLWFHVATEKVYNYQFQLPVEEVTLEPELALLEPPPGSLMVVVSATGKQLLRQKWRERGLKIIAAGFRPGRHQLKLTTANTFLVAPSVDVSLDEIISPTTVIFRVDQRAEAKVKVKPDIISEPDEGFAVSRISSTVPDEVTIRGPQATIRQITEVFTERKELSGLRNSLELTLPLALPSSYGVSLDPDSVIITLQVVPVKTRVFDDVPIVVYNSPPGQDVVVQPASIRVELTGPPSEIDLLNKNALIASADYNKIDESGHTPLKIDCPSKFRVKKSSVDSVALLVR
jgi:YbbR domain-containing protein